MLKIVSQSTLSIVRDAESQVYLHESEESTLHQLGLDEESWIDNAAERCNSDNEDRGSDEIISGGDHGWLWIGFGR